MTKRILSFCLVFLSMVTATRTACAYYDPSEGRFISEDTYLGDPGTPPSLHRYLYAYSNPTVYIDLSGYMSLDKHQEVSLAALEHAVKDGSFKMPSNGMIDDIKFTANLQIGSVLPDMQSEKAAKAYYISTLLNVLPTKLRMGKEIFESVSWARDAITRSRNTTAKDHASDVYMTIEKASNCWADISLIEPAVELASVRYPEIKENSFVRAHFYDAQWQHGMGQDPQEVRNNIIRHTMNRVRLYNEHVAKGDMVSASRELGMALHYLQDTWTPSHVSRDSEGKITSMYDYSMQSPKLHGIEDNFSSESTTQKNAINASVSLLKIIQDNGNDPEKMEEKLRNEIYPSAIDPNQKNPYAPRASVDDVVTAMKPYANAILKLFNTDVDSVAIKMVNQYQKIINNEGK